MVPWMELDASEISDLCDLTSLDLPVVVSVDSADLCQ